MARAVRQRARTFLVKRLAYRLQELTYGGLSPQAEHRLDDLADEIDGKKKPKAQDIATPVTGTRLVREWQGVMHEVTVPPLGYDVVERKLVVNEPEAELVRTIFSRFLQVGSATLLVKELNAAGHRTKSWVTKDGKARQGQLFTKNFLYKLLDNRVYLGEAVHKSVAHPGEHAAILDRATWDKVRAVLADNAPRKRANHTRAATPAPLKGLITCAHCGRAMPPTHTRKKGRLYRYYTCMQAIHAGHDACPVRSIAAGEIEAAVIAQVRALLRAPEIRARAERLATDLPAADVRAALDGFDALWEELFPAEQARLLQLLVDKILLLPDGAEVRLRAEGLASVVADLTAHHQRSAA